MKAQLSFEYFITTTLFVIFVVYLIFQVMKITPSFISELKSERIMSEAHQVSELLINDLGEPTNWDTVLLASIKRIGLSDNQNKINLLSPDKITGFVSHFGSVCTSATYENVRGLIDTEHNFNLNLVDNANNILIKCESPNPPAKPSVKASISRIVAIGEDSFGILSLQMW